MKSFSILAAFGLFLPSVSPVLAATEVDGTATVDFVGNSAGLAAYTTAENPVVLRFSITRPDGDWKDPQLQMTIRDFWRQTREGAKAELSVQGARIDVAATWDRPGPGWYYLDLRVSDGDGVWKVTRQLDDKMGRKDLPQILNPMFVVVPTPRSVGEVPDSPVAVDTLVTSSNVEVSDEKQIELAYLLGVRWVRERIAWGWLEKSPGEYDWDGSSLGGNMHQHGRRAVAITNEFHKRGIKVLEVFHGVPDWAAPAGSDAHKSFPEDLRHFYRWLETMGEKFSESVPAWTIWNEQDIGFFCAEPPDRYAAMVKAGALALRRTSRQPEVLLGSFARDPRVGGYDKILFANNVAAYVDVYDFHTYAPVDSGAFRKVLDTHLKVAEEAGLDRFWLTETAMAYTQDQPSTEASSREAQVRYLIDSYTMAFSSGVQYAFWHALRPAAPFSPIQFGMLNANLEPFPVYQALAVMAHTLGRGQYLGSFVTGEGVPVQLYQDGPVEVAVVMARKGETAVGRLPEGARAIDVMGGELPQKNAQGDPAGAVVQSRGWPFYLRGTTWKDRITIPAQVHVPGERRELPSPIVLRITYPQTNLVVDSKKSEMNWDGVASNWAPRGYTGKVGEKVEASVEVYNFSDQAASGDIVARLPGGTTASPAQVSYTVEPGGRVVLPVAIVLSGGGDFTFEAVDGKGQRQDISVAQWEVGQ